MFDFFVRISWARFLKEMARILSLQSFKGMWMQSLFPSLKTSASSVSSRAFTDVL